MAPLSSENHTLRLEPAYKTTFRARSFDNPETEPPAPPVATVAPSKKRHKRPKKGSKKVAKKPDTTPVSTPVPAAEDTRRPEDVPDFFKGKKRP